jgi:hypothetical protein
LLQRLLAAVPLFRGPWPVSLCRVTPRCACEPQTAPLSLRRRPGRQSMRGQARNNAARWGVKGYGASSLSHGLVRHDFPAEKTGGICHLGPFHDSLPPKKKSLEVGGLRKMSAADAQCLWARQAGGWRDWDVIRAPSHRLGQGPRDCCSSCFLSVGTLSTLPHYSVPQELQRVRGRWSWVNVGKSGRTETSSAWAKFLRSRVASRRRLDTGRFYSTDSSQWAKGMVHWYSSAPRSLRVRF